MSVFVLGKVDLGVDIMLPNYALFLIWWFLCYWLLLTWYDNEIKKGRKPKMNPLVAIILFIMSGFTPFIAIFLLFTKRTKS